jgi:hypothetical protein
MEIQRIEGGKPKKSSHYTLKLDIGNLSLRQLQEAGQVPPEKTLLAANIPPPDEEKDELFYPPEGFKPEEEIKDAEIVEEEKPQVEPEKQKELTEFDKRYIELAGIVAGIENLGGTVGPKQKKRLNELRTIEEIEKAKDYYLPILKKLEGK